MATLTCLTRKDLEKLQAEYPDYRMELVDGNIIIMSPSGYESDEVATEVARVLSNWVRPRKLGRVTGAGAGFELPNSNVRSPDVSFVLAERLRLSPRSFAELAPDLMIEVKSALRNLSIVAYGVLFLLLRGVSAPTSSQALSSDEARPTL